MRKISRVLSAAGALLLAGGTIRAQSTDTASVTVTAADKNAQHVHTSYKVHVLALPGTNRPAQWAHGATLELAPTGHFNTPTVPALPAPGFYPADLSNPGNGPTIQTAQSHPVYVNCATPGPHADPGSCWGDPATFLANLGASNFIHVVDQYVGSTANNRYTVGTAGVIQGYPVLAPLGDNDILNIVHAAASALGHGYHNLIHVFLPKGVDVCFTGTNECYSPDNPSTFVFCAYHGVVDFNDAAGHVIFSVEPYQNVTASNGASCQVNQPSPNGPVVDSTADTLSHELFEMITDPDIDGWLNNLSLDLFGAEIGDECDDFDFSYVPVQLNGKKYEVAPEYSNKYHGCAFVP